MSAVKLYNGYGYRQDIIIYGHVFKKKLTVRQNYSNNILLNIFHLLKLFFQQPAARVKVQLKWLSQVVYGMTEDDGFFKFEWRSEEEVQPGWHPVAVDHINEKGSVIASGIGEVFIPFTTQYGFISDIDDTILISHSATIRKRLWLLFTRNSRTRKAFENGVDFYKSLASAHTTPNVLNPFFYVSSSEWNLYDYLIEFFTYNGLPKGIFLLNELKQWFALLQTGKTKHNGKLLRILRVLKVFPHLKFILLGDNSQMDPEIYASIIKKYPGKIVAVYIRNIKPKNEMLTKHLLEQMEHEDVVTCLFVNNSDAISHAKKIGLIER